MSMGMALQPYYVLYLLYGVYHGNWYAPRTGTPQRHEIERAHPHESRAWYRILDRIVVDRLADGWRGRATSPYARVSTVMVTCRAPGLAHALPTLRCALARHCPSRLPCPPDSPRWQRPGALAAGGLAAGAGVRIWHVGCNSPHGHGSFMHGMHALPAGAMYLGPSLGPSSPSLSLSLLQLQALCCRGTYA